MKKETPELELGRMSQEETTIMMTEVNINKSLIQVVEVLLKEEQVNTPQPLVQETMLPEDPQTEEAVAEQVKAFAVEKVQADMKTEAEDMVGVQMQLITSDMFLAE